MTYTADQSPKQLEFIFLGIIFFLKATTLGPNTENHFIVPFVTIADFVMFFAAGFILLTIAVEQAITNFKLDFISTKHILQLPAIDNFS